MITGPELQEARRLLRWSADRVGAECNISPGAVYVFERTGKMPKPQIGAPPVDRLAVLRTVLEAAGLEFTNGDAPGVKLRKVEG